MSGDIWSAYFSRAFDLRAIPETADEIDVSYDSTGAFCMPSDIIPLRIHVKNRTAGGGIQFGVGIFVEAATGVIIGYLVSEFEALRLGMDEDFTATVTYRVPARWRGYDLRVHPLVWEGSRTALYYYQPFLAWTLPSTATLLYPGQNLVRFGFFLVTFAPLLPTITPEIMKRWLENRWQKTGGAGRIMAGLGIFICYILFWSVVAAFQYARP